MESSEVAARADPVYAEAEQSKPPAERCGSCLRVPAQSTQDAEWLPELFLLASLDRLADLRRRIPSSRPWRRPPLTSAAVQVSTLVRF